MGTIFLAAKGRILVEVSSTVNDLQTTFKAG